MKKSQTKRNLIKRQGSNIHALEGIFSMEDKPKTDFVEIDVIGMSLLKHEKPNGTHAEHFTLPVERGNFVMGRQVEYNPFTQGIGYVWD